MSDRGELVDTADPHRGSAGGHRPLTARSVIASLLLGVQPPRLPSRHLVAAGRLFGIAEGTIRVALSRMVTGGELVAEDGWYRLTGPLLERQSRQQQGRRAEVRPWNGEWSMAVVARERRSAPDRSDLRAAMRALRLAERREGVWIRPDNLDPDRQPAARLVADMQCQWFEARLVAPGRDSALAASLWDLEAWATGAERLQREMAPVVDRLAAGDTAVLAAGFVLSAAVLRHLVADPLLPTALLPRSWPGEQLRADYDRYDEAFQAVWIDALRPPA